MKERVESGTDELISERKKRIFSKKTLILLVLSLALVIFLVTRIDMERTVHTFRNADPLLLLACCVLYFMSNFFKALRFRVLLAGEKVKLYDLFIIASYHNFFNQIFPARTGELTFVYYLKKISRSDISKGIHSLFVVRIFDLIIVSVFFVGSVIIYFGRSTSGSLVLAGIIFFILSTAVLFNLKWFAVLFDRILQWCVRRFNLGDKKIIRSVVDRTDAIVEEFSSFKTRSFIPGLAITSILVWVALYTMFFTSIRAFGIDIQYIQSVAGATGGVLTNVLPINSFGSFGTLEAGWAGGFVLVGMSGQDAITTGFGYHLITFIASGLAALTGLLLYRSGPGRRRSA